MLAGCAGVVQPPPPRTDPRHPCHPSDESPQIAQEVLLEAVKTAGEALDRVPARAP